MSTPRVALLSEDGPSPLDDMVAASIVAGGGVVSELADAAAVIATAPTVEAIRDALRRNPDLRWIALPSAGIEGFLEVIDADRQWTCAKGAYGREVGEHALALLLGGLRGVAHFARHDHWGQHYGRSMIGGRVTILGGGDIATTLIRLLAPFEARVTVVRHRPRPMDGVTRVLPTGELLEGVRDADAVVLALALTPDTRHIIDAEVLAAMPEHAWLINVARGGHVDQDALLQAVREGQIAGAALDVTDPEPLPSDHPFWHEPRVLITPHVANPPGNAPRRLAEQVEQNVRRFAQGRTLLGLVDPALGY